MIIGIGIDVVDIERFGAMITRTPGFLERVLTPEEITTANGNRRSDASLAARFAAKEAISKALGAPPGLEWHDCAIHSALSGQPVVEMTGTVQANAFNQGVSHVHLSLSHDGGIATAYAIAEGRGR